MATNASPIIIVGLGNPGPRYALTRHNIGFMVLDLLADRWGQLRFQEKFKAQVAQAEFAERKVVLVKPQTFMNLSGESVVQVTGFYKVPIDSALVVISDDLDLPVATLRIRTKGGSGGHNGLKSIIESLGTEEFPRMRIGIGRVPGMDGAEYALARIPKGEEPQYHEVLNTAVDAIEAVVKEGLLKAMNTFNKKEQS